MQSLLLMEWQSAMEKTWKGELVIVVSWCQHNITFSNDANTKTLVVNNFFFSSMDDLSEVEAGQETSEREGHFSSSRNIKTSSHSNQLLEKFLNNQFLARSHPPLLRLQFPGKFLLYWMTTTSTSTTYTATTTVSSLACTPRYLQYFWFQLKSLCSCLLYIMWIPPSGFVISNCTG